jgi:hypothetical protein
VDELEVMGLKSAASDLREFAQTLPHKWELPNDYSHEMQHQERMAKEKAEWLKEHPEDT